MDAGIEPIANLEAGTMGSAREDRHVTAQHGWWRHPLARHLARIESEGVRKSASTHHHPHRERRFPVGSLVALLPLLALGREGIGRRPISRLVVLQTRGVDVVGWTRRRAVASDTGGCSADRDAARACASPVTPVAPR